MPTSFRITPSADPLDAEILSYHNITCVNATIDDFVVEAQAALGELRVEPHKLDKIKERIPTDLQRGFDANPASMARLLSSWNYVNQAAFEATPNIHDFLRGVRSNWALVGQSAHFLRDVEDEVYDCLLDYATALKTRQPVVRILGSAGYGMTTALMSLASRLVRENAGPVFMHKPETPLTEGDVEFACSLFQSRPFFFIDNAADYAKHIERARLRTRERRINACFVLGERRNEWRQSHSGLKAIEFIIDPLSDPEIIRLLECLEKHAALGVLADLSEELRVAAIRKKHDRQLLVVMREATEGKAFDAIIESEFRGLGSDLARRMYAVVACSYQLRQSIRDQLLADVVGVPLMQLYSDTRDATEGVVEFECVNEFQGRYVARCRHHSIAEIVWHRCVQDLERRDILLALVSKLNLDYHTDYQMFQDLVHSDNEIDSLGSLEYKEKFFSIASRKAPSSGFVRQHAARMQLRERRFERALDEIEEAIKLGPNIPFFKHTRGVVLRDMALANVGRDIGRKRMAQSEEQFQVLMEKRKWDYYSYQSLAELYLGWARGVKDEGEKAAYIAKCEEIVRAGLRTVRQREGLWIVSGQLQKWLGNEPNAMRLLERAAGGDVGRYLLAKMWLKQRNATKALEVLKPVVEADPTDPRPALLYARAQVMLGESYRKATAVLGLAKLHGMRDARYVATLGGMLFMDGEFEQAKDLFEEAKKKRFPVEEEQRLQFWPSVADEPQKRLRLVGHVSSVKTGYAWITLDGYPSFFCPGSKFRGIIMQPGLRIEFSPAFNARGNVVIDPKIASSCCTASGRSHA